MDSCLEVLKFPDSRLRNRAQRVEKVTVEFEKLIQDMMQVMREKNGVGLAAVQINRPECVFIADTRPDPNNNRYNLEDMGELERKIKQPLVCFNPEIISKEGEIIFNEGCLSLPGYFSEVKRAALVEMKALDIKGEPFTIKTDGLLAICLQHEVDHLNGKLYIDRLSSIRAQKLRDQIKKYGYQTEQKKTS